MTMHRKSSPGRRAADRRAKDRFEKREMDVSHKHQVAIDTQETAELIDKRDEGRAAAYGLCDICKTILRPKYLKNKQAILLQRKRGESVYCYKCWQKFKKLTGGVGRGKKSHH